MLTHNDICHVHVLYVVFKVLSYAITNLKYVPPDMASMYCIRVKPSNILQPNLYYHTIILMSKSVLHI